MPDPTYYQHTQHSIQTAGPLKGSLRARVCVIGAGFAGLATAIGLVERGMRDCVVLEAGQVGQGASGRNGGFLFGGYSLAPEKLLEQVGPERARALYRLTTQAVQTVRQRVDRYRIACDLNPAGVLLADWFSNDPALRKQQAFMNDLMGCDWQFVPAQQLREKLITERYGSALFEPDAAHLHPLNYCLGVAHELTAQGVPVHDYSAATAVEPENGGWRVKTADGEVLAEQVVVAAGGYIGALDVPAARSILPIATYIAVTEPLGDRLKASVDTESAVYDTRFAFDYYRALPDSRLLWGGRISARNHEPEALDAMLRSDLAKVFPELADVAFDFRWQGLMGYPTHQMPMVGESAPGLWHVIGFGGHGVAPTTALGELCAAAIAEGDQRYHWFDRWGLKPAYGRAGRMAAQLNYWALQARDRWRAAKTFS